MIKNKQFYETKHYNLTKESEQIELDNRKDLMDFIKNLNLYQDIEFEDINFDNSYYESLNFDYTSKLSKGLQLDVKIEPNNDYTTLDLKINSICREDFSLFQEFNDIYIIFQKDILTLKKNEEKLLSILKNNNNRIKKQGKIKKKIKNNLTEFQLFINGLSVNKIKHIFKPNTADIDSILENQSHIELLNYSFRYDCVIFDQYNIFIVKKEDKIKYMINNETSTKEKVVEIIKNSFFFKDKLATSFEEFPEFSPRLNISDLAKILEPEILKLNIDNF